MTRSFLSGHFCAFMDAYRDGRVDRVYADDLTFRLRPGDEVDAAVMYCIINDLDTDKWVSKLLAGWRELRQTEPPPIPANIILGGQDA